MFRILLAGVSVLAVSACGGTTTNAVPLAEGGFATADSEIVFGDSFTLPGVTRLVGDEDGNLSSEEQEIVFNILSEGEGVEVVLDGITYQLDTVNSDEFAYREGDDRVLLFRIGQVFDEAEIIEIFSVINDELNASMAVFGYDTDPAEVAARGGTAEMTGEIFVTVRNGFDNGFADGTVQITADFDANTISGNFDLTNRPSDTAEFTVPDLSFAMDSAEITGNTFAGTLTQTDGALGGTLNEASYNGRFFGADAPIAGGQVVGSVSVLGSDSPTFFEGAFLTSE